MFEPIKVNRLEVWACEKCGETATEYDARLSNKQRFHYSLGKKVVCHGVFVPVVWFRKDEIDNFERELLSLIWSILGDSLIFVKVKEVVIDAFNEFVVPLSPEKKEKVK